MTGFVGKLTIKLCGKPFLVSWPSGDRRLLANRKECYALVSFMCLSELDNELLRKNPLVKIEKIWIINNAYERDEPREVQEWIKRRDAYAPGANSLPKNAFTPQGDYLPPQAVGLPVEPARTDQTTKKWQSRFSAAHMCNIILKERFGKPRKQPWFSFRKTSPELTRIRGLSLTMNSLVSGHFNPPLSCSRRGSMGSRRMAYRSTAWSVSKSTAV